MADYDTKQSRANIHVIGSIDWSPEDWDYQTSNAKIERFLGEVKANGKVLRYTSF